MSTTCNKELDTTELVCFFGVRVAEADKGDVSVVKSGRDFRDLSEMTLKLNSTWRERQKKSDQQNYREKIWSYTLHEIFQTFRRLVKDYFPPLMKLSSTTLQGGRGSGHEGHVPKSTRGITFTIR